jgi:putative oxidoreductase
MTRDLIKRIPEFCMSHWLIRFPLIVVFLQQGLGKWPIDAVTADVWGLSLFVWSVVVLGEIGGAIGLIVGGLLYKYLKELGDVITRFSGITICSIMTGVIWIAQPTSITDVLLYDHFHVMLWVGGLFFALRGNKA